MKDKTPKQLVLEKYPKATCGQCFTTGVPWLGPENDSRFQVTLDHPFPLVYTFCCPAKTATEAWILAWYSISGQWIRTTFGKRTVS